LGRLLSEIVPTIKKRIPKIDNVSKSSTIVNPRCID